MNNELNNSNNNEENNTNQIPTMNSQNINQVTPTISQNTNQVTPTISQNANQVTPTISQNTAQVTPMTIDEQQIEQAYQKKEITVTQKKKHKFPIIIGIFILLIIFSFIIFYFISNNPNIIFKNTITKIEKGINKSLDEYNLDKSLTDINLKLNTTAQGFEEISKYTYGLKGGIDSKNKNFEAKIYMLNQNGKEYSYTGYLKNSKLYSLLSTYDKLIYLNEVQESDYKDLFESLEKIKKEDIQYLTTKISTTLKNNLNKKNITKTKSTIIINNKKINANKNIYKLDKQENERITKIIGKALYNDPKSMKIITNMTGLTKDEYKEEIDNYAAENDTETIINIYTKTFGNIIGFDIETEEEKISYYKTNEAFNVEIDDIDKLYINGIKKDDKVEVKIKQNEDQIATLNFDKLNKNQISFTYEIPNLEGNQYKGNLKYTKNNYTSNIEFKINNGINDYIFNFNINKKTNTTIANINESEAVTLSEQEMSSVMENFIKSLSETPIGALFSSQIINQNEINNYYTYS